MTMAYSRWGESYWYTYWASPGQGIEELRDTELFEICPVAMFTAKQLRDDLDGCIQQAAETETGGRKPTPLELDELREYVQEFLEDVNIKYSGLQ